MLRILILLSFLSACSMGTVKTGGEESYFYDARSEYTSEDLKELTPKVVVTSKRDPKVGTLDELFGPKQKPVKRVGILIFESTIQSTRGGLAGENLIYLAAQGKQLLTEKLLSIWQQSIPVLAPDLDFVSTAKFKKSKAFYSAGSPVEDLVQSNRNSLDPDDIFYIEKGKLTTPKSTMNPRGMRDLSLVLVPAYEMMGGPKWSEHQRHYVNAVAKELKLDAVIIVMNQIEWTAAHKDKITDDFIPEEVKFKIEASVLLPYSSYHERLAKIGKSDFNDATLCYRAYESTMKIPVLISFPPTDQNFQTIENELLSPMLKTYKDLSQMTIMKIVEDLKKTW